MMRRRRRPHPEAATSVPESHSTQSREPFAITIRAYLLLLTALTLLPMVFFGAFAAYLIAEREQSIFERAAGERSLAMLTSVDTELAGYIASLQGLASSYALQTGDLASFRREALRMLPTQPAWRSVTLARPSGERVLTASLAFGNRSEPVVDKSGLDAALRSDKPTVGNLSLEKDGYQFGIRMPVDAGGQEYVLATLIDPNAMVALLTPQRLPEDWVINVLDANNRIVARTANHTARLGQLANERLLAALAQAPEGWIENVTLEGTQVYTTYHRSPQSGWTVGLSIPASEIGAVGMGTLWLLLLGGLVSISAMLILASLLSRSISGPIASLASMARALGRGAAVTDPVRSRVSEIREVSSTLLNAHRAVSEREQKLRAADRAKNEFLAMLGHELRNPLGVLTSATHLLQISEGRTGGAQVPGTASAPQKSATEMIGHQIERITRLVDDLLDVGRVTSGKVQLALEPVDLDAVLHHVMDTLGSSRFFREHEVTCDSTPVWVYGDETRIEQIVTNLLENAGKYTPRGGSVHIRLHASDDRAVFEVEDTGIGLSPELTVRAFDLFSQGERSMDRSAGGLGIGLTLVKNLTEMHGGTVSVVSAGTNKGACFTVELPAIESPTVPLTSAAAPACADGDRAKSPPQPAAHRILLIEDLEDARVALAAVLDLYGYEVSEAADGAAGLEMAHSVRPDVAVIDIGLPEIDGYAVARRLRDGPFGRDIFLIALTGYGQQESRELAEAAGFDEYLTKPVSPPALVALIESLLERKRLRPSA